MVDYNKLGSCIDNVYNNTTQDPSRKVIATLSNTQITLRYVTVVEVATNEDRDRQTKEFEREAISMISSYKKDMSEMYKQSTGERLKLKEVKTSNPCEYEVLTVSPYSIRKIYKFNYRVSFDLG